MTVSHIKQHGHEANIQLDFLSFMSLALWMSLGVSLAFGIAFHFIVSTNAPSNVSAMNEFVVASFLYAFIGGIVSMIGAVLIYPFYKWRCERIKGQRLRGKFSIIIKDV